MASLIVVTRRKVIESVTHQRRHHQLIGMIQAYFYSRKTVKCTQPMEASSHEQRVKQYH